MAWPVFEEYNPENAKNKKKAARKSDDKGPDKKEVFRLNKVKNRELKTLFTYELSYFYSRYTHFSFVNLISSLIAKKSTPETTCFSEAFTNHLLLTFSKSSDVVNVSLYLQLGDSKIFKNSYF